MPFISRNVQLGPPRKLSNWRKAALGMWRTTADPSTYGFLDIDIGPALAYIEKVTQATGRRVTLSHFAGRAVGEVVARHPEINSVLRWGRLYARKTVDIFFHVATDEDGRDLSGMTIREIDKKSVSDIANEMAGRAVKIRQHNDPDHAKMKSTLGGLPGMMSGLVLRLVGFLAYSLNIWTPLFGLPRDAFGSVMVTNVGSLNLDAAFAPLVAYSRTPMHVAVGAARRKAVVGADDQVKVATVIRLCVTFDHRIVDGKYMSHMAKTTSLVFADPEKYFGAPHATPVMAKVLSGPGSLQL